VLKLLRSRRHGRALGALLVVAAVSATTLGLLVTPGGAVTSSSPSTNVGVTFTTPITGLTDGSTVGFTVAPTSGETLNGDIESRICTTGTLITNNAQFGNSGGRCVDPNTASPAPPAGLVGAQYLKQHGIFSGAAAVPLTHNVGTGTVQWFAGSLRTITCNNLNPCNLVIKVNTNGGAGVVFFTETLNFAAPPAVPAAPSGLSAVAGDGDAVVSFTKDITANPAVTGYGVTATPAATPACSTAVVVGPVAAAQPVGPGPVSVLVSPLVNGCEYGFTATATNAQGTSAPAGPVLATPLALARFIFQTITVERPTGALVLTQSCAGPLGDVTYPYPDENLPVGDVSDVVYPTTCSVALGKAILVKTGPYKGQYFRQTGALQPVNVVDTREEDTNWTVNGILTGDKNFHNGGSAPRDTFSGRNLGWTPQPAAVTPPIPADDVHAGYTQVVGAGPQVVEITEAGNGLKASRVWASAAAGQGLGIALLNANIAVMIPIFNNDGIYSATLQITAI